MKHAGDARQTLLALEESGVKGSVARWERLLAINYIALIGRGSNIIDVGARRADTSPCFSAVWALSVSTSLSRIRLWQRSCVDDTERDATSKSSKPRLPSEWVAPSSSSILGAPGESGLRQRAFSNPDRARIQRITVPIGRLDDQRLEGAIHYVKNDVEGGEVGVLRGGRDFLARHRPILSVEYGQSSYAAYGHTADTLYEEAMLLGYAVCDLFGNVFRSIEEWRFCVDRLYWDYLLIPKERLEATAGRRAEIARRAEAELRRQARLRKLARRLPLLASAISRRLKRLA